MTGSRFSHKIRFLVKSGFMAVGFILFTFGLAKAQMFAPAGNMGGANQSGSLSTSSSNSGVWSKPASSTTGSIQNYRIGSVEEDKKKPQIILYMRDFKISKTLNGNINCTMRFYVYSGLKEKINNLSYRLKWPSMETALSFDDIAPNTKTYFDYSLLGQGCYSMDKAPNVIVNRCRVKGMSQQQCAQSIRWAD